MNTEYCKCCGEKLLLVGVQKYTNSGIQEDMMHCDNPDCPEYTRTKSYHKRIIDRDAYETYLERKNRIKAL